MERLFTMSKQEITRLEILQRLIDRKITQVQAGEILHMGTRQIQRLVRTYRLQGVAGLISKKRGKPGNRALPKTIKEYAATLVKQHYHDFGPTLAAEKLLEYHDIKLSVETVRSLMIEAGLWISRNKRLKRSFQPRYRRERFGELIQIDGSHHRWFEDRGPKCALLVYVDDATSKLTALHFAPSESMHSYFIARQKHLSAYGRPITFPKIHLMEHWKIYEGSFNQVTYSNTRDKVRNSLRKDPLLFNTVLAILEHLNLYSNETQLRNFFLNKCASYVNHTDTTLSMDQLFAIKQ